MAWDEPRQSHIKAVDVVGHHHTLQVPLSREKNRGGEPLCRGRELRAPVGPIVGNSPQTKGRQVGL